MKRLHHSLYLPIKLRVRGQISELEKITSGKKAGAPACQEGLQLSALGPEQVSKILII